MIAQLEAFGEDSEALAAALAVAETRRANGWRHPARLESTDSQRDAMARLPDATASQAVEDARGKGENDPSPRAAARQRPPKELLSASSPRTRSRPDSASDSTDANQGRNDAVAVDNVEVETQYTLWTQRQSRDEPESLTRSEHQLVLQLKAHLEALGDEVKSKRIRLATGSAMRTDLFNISRHQLVEAKENASREKIRMALGQLLDYERFIDPPPELAVLVPNKPADDLIDLLSRHDVGVIWRVVNTFHDTRNGAFV